MHSPKSQISELLVQVVRRVCEEQVDALFLDLRDDVKSVAADDLVTDIGKSLSVVSKNDVFPQIWHFVVSNLQGPISGSWFSRHTRDCPITAKV